MRKFFSNPKLLTERVIDKDLTLSQAARSAKLSAGKFIPLTRFKEEISRRVADKLRATFGEDAVTEVET